MTPAVEITLVEGVVCGIIGGAVAEFYVFYRMRHTFHSNRPAWIRSWFYWINTTIMVLLGGGAVYVYMKSGVNLNYFAALQLGVSTPLLIGTLKKQRVKIG